MLVKPAFHNSLYEQRAPPAGHLCYCPANFTWYFSVPAVKKTNKQTERPIVINESPSSELCLPHILHRGQDVTLWAVSAICWALCISLTVRSSARVSLPPRSPRATVILWTTLPTVLCAPRDPVWPLSAERTRRALKTDIYFHRTGLRVNTTCADHSTDPTDEKWEDRYLKTHPQ